MQIDRTNTSIGSFRSGRPRPAGPAVAVAFVALFCGAPVYGVEKHWNVGTGLWGSFGNWSPSGVPGGSDLVYVDFFSGGPGTAVVNLPMGSPNSVTISNDNVVRMLNNGSLGAGGDFIVGGLGTHGTLNLLNPNPVQAYFANVTAGTMRIGMFSGNGTVNQNGGVVTVNQLLRVGDRHSPGNKFKGVGTYNLSGNGVLNAGRLEVGYGGDTGQFSFIEGTFNLSGFAVLNVHPNGSIPDPKIGGGGANGVFNQTGGTFRSQFRILDIAPNGGSGAYNYSGGVFDVPGVNFANPNARFNYLDGDYLYLNQISMTNGRIVMSSGGDKVAHSRLLWTSSSNWRIDVNDNAMIIGATLGESVPSALFRGFSNGSWNGTGIISSTAAAAWAGSGPRTGLGFGKASDLGITHYGGVQVSPDSYIIEYTLIGDADLDQVVNLADFNILAANFGDDGKEWWQGDFNYDGIVSLHDFNLFAANFGLIAAGPAVAPQDWANLAAAVPEPASLAAVGATASAMLLRRRRQR